MAFLGFEDLYRSDLRTAANGVTPIPAAMHTLTSYRNTSRLAEPNGPSTARLGERQYSEKIKLIGRWPKPRLQGQHYGSLGGGHTTWELAVAGGSASPPGGRCRRRTGQPSSRPPRARAHWSGPPQGRTSGWRGATPEGRWQDTAGTRTGLAPCGSLLSSSAAPPRSTGESPPPWRNVT